MGSVHYYKIIDKHNKNRPMMSKYTVALGLSSVVLATQASIIQTRQESNDFLRQKRDVFDPDTYCNNKLTKPSCWEEFAETVWQPFRPWNNMVSKAEGKDLAYCVKKCSTGDWFKDFVGTAYEEKRETREEYHDMSIITQDKSRQFVGCAQCCEFIPKSLRHLPKVRGSCGFGSDTRRRNNN